MKVRIDWGKQQAFAAWLLLLQLAVAVLPAESDVVSVSLYIYRVPARVDGYPRSVLAVYAHNGIETAATSLRPFPGPVVRAKIGDELRVTVVNRLEQSTTSLHFHGLHNLKAPWVDGAPGITECGIASGRNFTYVFQIEQTGTFWYHSHVLGQYSDGVQGAVILQHATLDADPVYRAYPYIQDYPILIQDWFHETSEDLFVLHDGPYGAFPGFQLKYPWPPTSVLINGRGQFDCQYVVCPTDELAPCHYRPECINIRPPLMGDCVVPKNSSESFVCEEGQSIRLRIINTASTTPLRFWIDQHPMIVVARDGVLVQPKTVISLATGIGERYDVIVQCKPPRSGLNYQMFVSMASGLVPDASAHPLLWYSAILSYHADFSLASPLHPVPESINNASIYGDTHLFSYQFTPLVPKTAPGAARRLLIQYYADSGGPSGSMLEWWILNGRTFQMPLVPFLQAMQLGLPASDYIVSEPGQFDNSLSETYVEHFEYGKVYEVVMLSVSSQQHPWHLHGYTLDFVEANQYEKMKPLSSNTSFHGFPGACNWTDVDMDAITKELLPLLPSHEEPRAVIASGDSFVVPRLGYVIFRFHANNPGPWLFHCHVQWHLIFGQAMIFSVENADGNYKGLIRPPSVEESKCGLAWAAVTGSSPLAQPLTLFDVPQGNYLLLMFLLVVTVECLLFMIRRYL